MGRVAGTLPEGGGVDGTTLALRIGLARALEVGWPETGLAGPELPGSLFTPLER